MLQRIIQQMQNSSHGYDEICLDLVFLRNYAKRCLSSQDHFFESRE